MYEYNTKRKPLVLREYGRNVQKLVAQLGTIEDRAIRTQQARAILKLMNSLGTCDKQATEYSQKRWDDLFIIADYTLDVESNYPMPTRNLFPKKSFPLAYKKQPIKYRHYGRHVERLIEQATEITSPTEQERVVTGIARLIKNCSSVWNKEKLDNSTILATMQDIAGGKLTAALEKIKAENIFQIPPPKTRTNKTGRLAFAAKTKQAQ